MPVLPGPSHFLLPLDEHVQQSLAAFTNHVPKLHPDLPDLDHRHASASGSNGLHRSLGRRKV